MTTVVTTPKQRVVNRLMTNGKRDLDVAEPEPRPVLEHMLYAIIRENVSRAEADEAFQRLQTQFFDWNEIRVSPLREVADALEPLPDADRRAERLIELLSEVFETTFSFDMESLIKKGLKQAEKQIERFRAANPFLIAYTVQRGLDGHFLPLDGVMRRTLARLHVIDDEPAEGEGSGIDHLVPKARAVMFCETVSALTHSFCLDRDPNCLRCPLNDACPTGQANLKPAKPGVRALARVKAR